MNKVLLYTLLLGCCLCVQPAFCKNGKKGFHYERIQMETLGRGLRAVHQGKGTVSVSWRMLVDDTKTRSFNLYRQSIVPGQNTGKEVKLNDKPLKASSFFLDKVVDTTVINIYTLQDARSSKKKTQFTLTPEAAKTAYVRIPLPAIDNELLNAYMPGDASVGDLDGDGEYEIVVQRHVGNLSTDKPGLSGGSLRLEAYKMDGTRLWHMDLGQNIREGQLYFSFVVYDFNRDGKAEILCKTAEGTVFGDGKRIGDTNNDGTTDYVVRIDSLNTYGKILSGPEFLSAIDGLTGSELARTEYIQRGSSVDWGDDIGDKVDRQFTAMAYLDGKRPSFIMCRGNNGRIVMQAINFRNNSFEKVWTFDTNANNFKHIAWSNQGNNSLRVGDVDYDGKDEILFGSCVVDDNGQGLYASGFGPGQAQHLADIDPDKPGLELWQSHSFAPNPNSCTLLDAATGKSIQGFASKTPIFQALTADIDPNYYGMEIWSPATAGVYSCTGKLISKKLPTSNMAIWWDGDLSRELLDKFYIDKWTGDGTIRLFNGKGKGLTWCNGSKATPCLSADVFGDWREEIIWPSADGKELRIYTTDIPTDLRITCLMQDPIYRMGVANENSGYNQPPHTGFYLGSAKPKFTQFFYK